MRGCKQDRLSYIRLDYVSIGYHVEIYGNRLCSVWLDNRLGDIGIIIPPHGHHGMLCMSKPHMFCMSLFCLCLVYVGIT